MAFFIKKIAEIFDQTGIGYTVNQHTIGFGHQFGAGFGKGASLRLRTYNAQISRKLRPSIVRDRGTLMLKIKAKLITTAIVGEMNPQRML